MQASFDYVLVGGGLANGLVALALAHHRPGCRIALIERGLRLGGDHTWCFHAADLDGDAAWIEPLVVRRWDGYRVAFDGWSRRLDSPYAWVSSERFHQVVHETVSARQGSRVYLGAHVEQVTARSVALADGTTLSAEVVVDARGPERRPLSARTGHQKFLGLEIELDGPHSVPEPVVFDATVDQRDGFHFLYLLPFGPKRLLIEDTYFSDSAHLDEDASRRFLTRELRRRGMGSGRVLREERGNLPLPYSIDPTARAGADEPILAGWAGGWFHPVTGYSFPIAVRVARWLATTPPAELRGPAYASLVSEHDEQLRFARLLNWMLFELYAPEDRTHVLERFYRLPEDTIRRFYALRTTRTDRARILCGRPPRGLSLRRLLRSSGPALPASAQENP